jgi:hypothetical protein
VTVNPCARCGVRPAEARTTLCARCVLIVSGIDGQESMLVDANESPPCELLSIIGETPRAITFLGEQRWPVRRLVALKVLKSEGCSPDAVARARRPLPSHPSIAAILESGYMGGRPYVMTAFLGGGAIINRFASIATSASARVVALLRIADALLFAHAQGLAHGRLVASNLLCEAHAPFAVHIVDFECNARKAAGDLSFEILAREDVDAVLALAQVLRVDVERLQRSATTALDLRRGFEQM